MLLRLNTHFRFYNMSIPDKMKKEAFIVITKLPYKKILIISITLYLSGCSVKKDEGNTVSIRLKEDPTTLDPAYIVDVAGGGIAAKLYNGLVRYDENLNIVADLASKWEVDESGLIYTFYLKPDVRFSNGKELESSDIFEAFQRVRKDSPKKWIFDKVKEFQVPDEKTFKIILKEPFSPFLSFLTLPNAYITTDGKIGTGPFVVTEWERDQYLILSANKNYFGGRPKTEKIEYRIISEELTALYEFRLGNLDILEVSPSQWADPKKTFVKIARKYSQTGLNTYYIGFNFGKPYLRRTDLRQALNYAIDREAVIDTVLKGQGALSSGPVPPALLPYAGYYSYKYLPNKAKKIFKRHRFAKKLKLYVRAQAQAIQIAEVIQYYLSEAGVVIEIVPLEWSAFKKAISDGEPDLFLMSWWADYPDPENFIFPPFHSSNKGAGGNRTGFSNKIIDRLIEEAQREMDKTKRDKLYEKLQRYINRRSPWIFLWHAKELMLVNSDIDGYKQYPVYSGDKGTEVEKIRMGKE